MATTYETRIIKIEIDTGPVEKAAISIKSLTDANKKLREERKLLDVTTKDGQKQIDLINQSLDRNDKIIKSNSSSLEKQRLNVGNYTKSIKEAIPALDGMTDGAVASAQGMGEMTKSSLAFIATPVGAILGAIALALAAVMAYLKGSEEGQNRLNRILAVGNVLWERFQDVLETVGKALFEAPAKFDKFATAIKIAFFPVTAAIASVKLLAEVFSRFFPESAAAIKKYFTDIVDDADKISSLEEAITKQERALVTERASTELQVAILRENAAKSSGDAKEAFIKKAIALEHQLSDAEVSLAEKRLELARQNVKIGIDDIAGNNAVAAAEAAVNIARKTAFDNTIKFQKELEALRVAERAQHYADQKADSDAKIAQVASENAQVAELRAADFQEGTSIEDEAAAHKMKLSSDVLFQKSTDEEAATLKASIEASKREAIAKIEAENKRDAQFAALLQASAFMKQIAGKNKAIAIGSIIIDTYVGAAKAISAYAAFPPLAAVMAAIIVAMGIANVAKVAGVQFATGGYTGSGQKYEPAGVVHRNEFVVPSETVNKYGVGHFNRYLPGYADGGLVTNQAVSATNEQAAISNAVRMLTNISISWKEGLLMDDRIKFKEALTTR